MHTAEAQLAELERLAGSIGELERGRKGGRNVCGASRRRCTRCIALCLWKWKLEQRRQATGSSVATLVNRKDRTSLTLDVCNEPTGRLKEEM